MFKFIIALAFLIMASTAVYSQSKAKKLPLPSGSVQPKSSIKTAPAKKPDGKLDVSELEDKYWAPKDTDFNVVQNRTYTKEKRFSASLLFGTPTNDLFNQGTHLAFIGNYYFSERFGVELNYISSNLSPNSTVEAFQELGRDGDTSPNYSAMSSSVGAAFNWVPFYAKMSFLNQKIIYFDMAFSPAISSLTYAQQTESASDKKTATALSFGFDITQSYFFSKNLAIRVDLKNRWFTEELVSFSDGTGIGTKASTLTMFLIGGTFFF